MCLCKLVMTHDSLLIVRFVFFQPWLLWVFLFYASPVLRFNLQSAFLEKVPLSASSSPFPFKKRCSGHWAGSVAPLSVPCLMVPR